MDRAIAAEALGDQAAAEEAYRRLADVYRERGDDWAEAQALASAENSAANAAESDSFSPGVWTAGPGGSEAGIAASFLQLGHVASVQGDYTVALPLLSDALAAYQRLGDANGAARAQERIALTALRQNDLETAHRAAEEALLLRRQQARRRDSHDSRDGSAPSDADADPAFAEKLLREIERADSSAGTGK